MKKTVCFIALVFVLIGLVFAEYDLDSLSPQQRQQFLLNSLSVEVGSKTSGTMVSGTNVYGKSAITTGSLTSSTSVVWTPFFGGSEISKADFFLMTGDEQNYQKVLEYEKERDHYTRIKWTLYGIGMGVAVVGLVYEFIPIFARDFSDEALKKVYIGAGIGLAGCSIALGGLIYGRKAKQEVNISAQYAIGVADAYNYELFQKISLNVNL